jgi:hypothetical protein
MQTRPIYHASDAAIRGHVFCSFLALVLRKELDAIESGSKIWTVRTQADDCAAALLQSAGIAPPPRIQATPPP